MLPVRFRCRLTCLCFAVLAASPLAAQTGKLSGRVTDEGNGPLVGVTVLFVGTTRGVATGPEGDYAVINVPVGTYSVRFSMVGFQTKTFEEVLITSNNTATLDVTLSEEVLQGEELVVVAERPIIDVSQTSSKATLAREDIAVLPVQELKDIVNLQAGVVEDAAGNLHFRGGRSGEVQYQVDGVSVNNPFNNRSSVQLDRSVLQEVQVVSGTYDAEYGQAMSGVVNAVLRSGDEREYAFNLEVFGGDYFSPGNDSIDTVLGGRTAYFPHIDRLSPLTIQNYQASLSGPVPRAPRTVFLLNGQRFVNNSYLAGVRDFVPTDSSDFERGVFVGTGDGEVLPLAFDRRLTWLGKVTNRSLSSVKLEYQVIGNLIRRRGYNHAFRFNPDGTRTQREFSVVHGLDWTHAVSDRLFYTLSVRHNVFDLANYKYREVDDARYFAAGPPRASANFQYGAVVEGVDLGRFVQQTQALVIKGTATSQVTPVHLVKAGVELHAFDLRFGVPGQLVQTSIDGVQQLVTRTDTVGARVLDFRPVAGVAFVQDRVEWRDLRIRAGVRLEIFDANESVPSDLRNPANSIEGAPPSEQVATTGKLALAPRLGVSFPILDQASLYFSYGHFYQMPELGILFSNSDYQVLEDLQFGDEDSKGVLGNPDLDPEFTVQYEFGFKAELAPWLGLGASLFYKDVRSLLGVEFVQTFTAARYARFTNVDFGQVRGFTVSLDQRGPGALSASIDYSFQRAIGNSSDPRETFNRAAAGEDAEPRQVPFNWDQRHTLNGTLTWYRRDSFAVTAVLRSGTGQPFTPSISSVFGSDLEPNSGRKNAWFLVDLRGEKFFTLGSVRLTGFVRVFNLLDQHFVNGFVFSDTGSPFYSLTPQAQLSQLNNPSRFHRPRRFEIGLSLSGAVSR